MNASGGKAPSYSRPGGSGRVQCSKEAEWSRGTQRGLFSGMHKPAVVPHQACRALVARRALRRAIAKAGAAHAPKVGPAPPSRLWVVSVRKGRLTPFCSRAGGGRGAGGRDTVGCGAGRHTRQIHTQPHGTHPLTKAHENNRLNKLTLMKWFFHGLARCALSWSSGLPGWALCCATKPRNASMARRPFFSSLVFSSAKLPLVKDSGSKPEGGTQGARAAERAARCVGEQAAVRCVQPRAPTPREHGRAQRSQAPGLSPCDASKPWVNTNQSALQWGPTLLLPLTGVAQLHVLDLVAKGVGHVAAGLHVVLRAVALGPAKQQEAAPRGCVGGAGRVGRWAGAVACHRGPGGCTPAVRALPPPCPSQQPLRHRPGQART